MTDELKLTPAAQALLTEIVALQEIATPWRTQDGSLRKRFVAIEAEARATTEAEIAELRAALDIAIKSDETLLSKYGIGNPEKTAYLRRLLAAPPTEPENTDGK
jgi:hypothetical protein